MVKCVNLGTKKLVCTHLNDLRDFKRPNTRACRVNDSEIKRVFAGWISNLEAFQKQI